MDDWINSQVKKIKALPGNSINEWCCIEMALSESEIPAELVWHHNSVPYLQVCPLYAKYGNRWIRFLTYQSDEEFGLHLDSSDIPNGDGMSGIYRFRDLNRKTAIL